MLVVVNLDCIIICWSFIYKFRKILCILFKCGCIKLLFLWGFNILSGIRIFYNIYKFVFWDI